MKKLVFFSLISFNILSQTPGAGVTDIDGNQYSSVIIGSQEWMTENLRTESFSNGDNIPNVSAEFDWSILSTAAWCNYENTMTMDGSYGKLYNWFVIEDSRNICPDGWHIPSKQEYISMIDYLGGDLIAGGKLKEEGILNWSAPNTGATNQSGFTGIPGGYRANGGSFTDLAYYGFWWSSTEETASAGFIMYLHYDNEVASIASGNFKDGLSIRCAKPASSSGVIELSHNKRVLVRITDLMGRETEFTPNTVLIYVYSDGTTERVLQIEQ